MWVLKFKAKEEPGLYNKKAFESKVRILFYSRNFYEKGKKIFFINSGIVQGEDKNKKKFFSILKKEKKIEKIEINNDFFISIYSELKTSLRVNALKTIYNPKIIFLRPAIIDEQGWEEWEVASFDRKDLEEIIKQAEKLLDKFKNKKSKLKILSFKEKKAENLMIHSILPNLTGQQKKVFDLTVSSGYYGYPRKAKLQDLAKQFGLSLSTFQFHLAKAEAKLMPFFSKKL